jgi:hypothetical protein
MPVVCAIGIVLLLVPARDASCAALGWGTRGEFVAVDRSSLTKWPHNTDGYFVASDGSGTLNGVVLHGPSLGDGDRVPAIRYGHRRGAYVQGSWSYALFLWGMWLSAWFFLFGSGTMWWAGYRGARSSDEALILITAHRLNRREQRRATVGRQLRRRSPR